MQALEVLEALEALEETLEALVLYIYVYIYITRGQSRPLAFAQVWRLCALATSTLCIHNNILYIYIYITHGQQVAEPQACDYLCDNAPDRVGQLHWSTSDSPVRARERSLSKAAGT